MAEHLRLINPDQEPQNGWFVTTTIATDILRSLRNVQNRPGGGLTMIAAAPGMGKTATL